MTRLGIAILSAAGAFSLPGWGQTLNRDETRLQWAYTALHMADWAQTRRIAADPQWIELNPILGTKPRQVEVNRYFAATLAAHWAIAQALPREGGYRRAFQQGTVTLQMSIVQRNYSLGIGFKF